MILTDSFKVIVLEYLLAMTIILNSNSIFCVKMSC